GNVSPAAEANISQDPQSSNTVALDERWAQWTVNQTACQDCLGRWTTFTAEERARNFTRSVHTLFNIHGQWEEIKTFARLVRCSHGGQQHGVIIEIGGDRTISLTG